MTQLIKLSFIIIDISNIKTIIINNDKIMIILNVNSYDGFRRRLSEDNIEILKTNNERDYKLVKDWVMQI